MIRCKICGFMHKKFHGWVFIYGRCSGKHAGPDAMIHDWEEVK